MGTKTKTKTAADYASLYMVPWQGSKYYVARKIWPYIPDIRLARWAEPFGGAGGMLLSKSRWADQEIWNDNHGEMYNLWAVIRDRYGEFCEAVRYQIKSRDMFRDHLASDPADAVSRAVRFFYLCQYSFGANGTHFAVSRSPNIAARIDRLHARIQHVWIEHLDWQEFLGRYQGYVRADAPDRKTFFFIDPPYMGATASQYGGPFDHDALAEAVKRIPDLWLLTLNDTPETRSLYKDYPMAAFSRNLSTENRPGRHASREYRELIVANYDLDSVRKQNETKGQGQLWND